MSEQIIVIKKTSSFDNDDTFPLQEVKCGTHIQDFLEYQKIESGLDETGCLNLRNSACNILNYCNPHNAITNIPTTHLVVGYVQSGKTMSFTSLVELALDNKYKVVIIIAGITTSLLRQTDDRLGNDLACNDYKKRKFFKIHKNPKGDKAEEICRNLKIDDSIIIINVLKHAGRINNVSEIFANPNIQKALQNETVLIIDDEADQASLNNYGRSNSKVDDEEKKKMSKTYEAILKLRNLLPGNSYIQYTATPQANILINASDILSPKTHTLLKPGKGYCGGKLFFGVGEEGKRFKKGLIKEIPAEEVFNSKLNALQEIPKSLKDALMLHIWAVIINTILYENTHQLSMMVHTDVKLKWNAKFYKWINETLTEWSNILDSEENGIKKYKLEEDLERNFKEAIVFYSEDFSSQYNELKSHVVNVLNDTHVYLITGDTNDMEDLEWEQHCSNILVGAQMLNRGFTVKNLSTTYMPRYSTTISNADTIEQRCRFFGYKEKYIRSCRVFLPKISIENYENYITGEEELRAIMEETKSMEECGHKILSYPKLRPTRTNVLPKTVVTTSLVGMKEFAPYCNEQMMAFNLGLIDNLISEFSDITKPFKTTKYDYSKYNGFRLHKSFRIPINIAINFLKRFQLGHSSDCIRRADTIRYLLYLQDNNTIKDVEIINMSEGRFKERNLGEDHKLNSSNIFNGPSNAGDKNSYIGDNKMFVSDTVSIQLHHIHLVNHKTNAGVIAIHYPKELAVSYTSSL